MRSSENVKTATFRFYSDKLRADLGVIETSLDDLVYSDKALDWTNYPNGSYVGIHGRQRIPDRLRF